MGDIDALLKNAEDEAQWKRFINEARKEQLFFQNLWTVASIYYSDPSHPKAKNKLIKLLSSPNLYKYLIKATLEHLDIINRNCVGSTHKMISGSLGPKELFLNAILQFSEVNVKKMLLQALKNELLTDTSSDDRIYWSAQRFFNILWHYTNILNIEPHCVEAIKGIEHLLSHSHLHSFLHDGTRHHAKSIKTKELLLDAILKLPEEQKISYLRQCLDKNTALGEHFWWQRGRQSCSIDRGTLKIVQEQLNPSSTIFSKSLHFFFPKSSDSKAGREDPKCTDSPH